MRQAGPARSHRKISDSGLFDNAAFGVAYLDHDLQWIRINQQFARGADYALDELLSQSFMDLLWPRDSETVRARLEQLWLGALESYKIETQFRKRGGEYYWVDITFAIETDERRSPAAILLIVQDAELRKAAEERQRLLLAEINHRVRNMLATVQSIAMQTWRHADCPARFVESFSARLGSLAAVHDALTDTAWRGADLSDLIHVQLAQAGVTESSRVWRSGPSVFLPPRIALHLSLILHELATNAVRHGALSMDDGRVEVAWRLRGVNSETALALTWIESGGPPANAPHRLGLGTLLIERAATDGLDAKATLSWKASGLDAAINVPIPSNAWRQELFRP